MIQVKPVFELSVGTEQEVTEHPVAVLRLGSLGVGQHGAVVVGQFRADDRRRAQQALGQFLGEFGVDVVGDSRGRVVADFQQ
ncbi:hypothetical protein D3C73_1236110 [compost metagenome]